MRNMLGALLVSALVLSVGSVAFAQDKAHAPTKSPTDINTATLAQLEDLPGIGRVTAERILEYRQKSGGFKKVEETSGDLGYMRFSGEISQCGVHGFSLSRLSTWLKGSGNCTRSHQWWAQRWRSSVRGGSRTPTVSGIRLRGNG